MDKSGINTNHIIIKGEIIMNSDKSQFPLPNIHIKTMENAVPVLTGDPE